MAVRSLKFALIASGAIASVVLAASSAILAVACGSFTSSDDAVVDASGEASGEAGVSPDAADATMTSDGAPSPGAEAGPPNGSGIDCGTAGSCDPQTEVCCEHLIGGGVGCLPVGMRGMCQGLDLGCDDGADCASMAGGVCCGIHDSTRTAPQTTSCATLTSCMKQDFWVVVCDQNAPAGTACPNGVGCHVPDGGAYGFCDGLISAQ